MSIQNSKYVFSVYFCLLYLLVGIQQGSAGSDITYSVTASSIDIQLNGNVTASLSEIMYTTNESPVITILRFPDETYSSYKINDLESNVEYTFNIIKRIQGQDSPKTVLTLTTNAEGSTNDNSDGVSKAFRGATIALSVFLVIALIAIVVMEWKLSKISNSTKDAAKSATKLSNERDDNEASKETDKLKKAFEMKISPNDAT
ncbi:uncharacterized protein [Antedon mediterranea]|uniref:uncharacterized protein n=1 Tax=Antedon mediterranea TaxID=105859 RepID=UPI003AF758E9